jgi:2-polyprenyl-3-methyl-5-hydroxy-6-metoxy-1,4-benzoquinol methylase
MVAHFWDYESRFPDRYFAYQHGAEIVRQIKRHLKQDGSVLDYGCGPGYLIDELLTAGFRVAGLDTSAESRKTVVERFRDRPGFLGAFDPRQLAGAGLRFDAVTVIEVIEHLYDDQLHEVLQALPAFLNEQGVAIFTTPNEEDLGKSYILCPVSNQLFHRWQHVRSWSASSLRADLARHDYAVTACLATNFGASLQARGIRRRWAALRTRFKYLIKPDKKRPHLVAVARPQPITVTT